MIRRLYLPAICALAFFSASAGYAQKHFVKDYKEGFYYSYEDFVSNKIRPLVTIERRSLFGNKVLQKEDVVDQVFFYRVKDTSKVTDIFAISFQGNLYFKQREMSKHAKKGDRDETGSNPNLYHRVIKDGNFFYMEGMFGSGLAKGLGYGSGGAVGGAMASNVNQFKGVIYDFSKNEFDFFRKCKDFNTFLSANQQPEMNCEDKEYSTMKVREIIDKLISQ
ncbi:hypothetical protein [Flavobacterium wongokense]|uniref:hypothetical protein n=1 Tax=Flavobacterium wongokense TaxID=2910674 RepID=UPI001F1E6BF8|nr:hypothetical protein [Flavobacterium sp. WG47]MCF6131553.1 hypothetical protein [Flavobacterium sp. WG47]